MKISPVARLASGHSQVENLCHVALLAILLLLTVSASAAIKQEIPDLRPPKDELPPVNQAQQVLPWFIAAGAAAVLAGIVGWLRRPKPQIVESPGEKARGELQAVTAPQAVAQVLRRYLLAAFPLPGEGASTEEISDCLYSNIPSDPTLAHQVSEFLLACDTEKFAPVPAAGNDAVAAAAAAGWAPKPAGAASGEATSPAPATAAGAREVALSLIDKIEKRRHRPAQERAF